MTCLVDGLPASPHEMSPSTTQQSAVPGPVSAVLEAELREWVRRHQIVVWLDADGHYSAFVDGLTRHGRSPGFEIRALRGSFLELATSLEGLAGGTEKPPLVIHVPGYTEETIKTTPLLELYAAGVRYRKSLDTLVTEAAAGKAKPGELADLKAKGHLSLEDADTWLDALLREDQGGLAARLRARGLTGLVDDLLGERPTATRIGGSGGTRAVLEQISSWTGLSATWEERTLSSATPRPSEVAFAAAGWALCVEYVDDLRRETVSSVLAEMRDLPAPLVESCRRMAAHLRAHHAGFYRDTAQEMELLLPEEIEAARAEDLGKVDTFRFEEDKVLEEALTALGEKRWGDAERWAGARVDPGPKEGSFWLREDPKRLSAWLLIHKAARLGLAIAKAGERLGVTGPIESAAEAYAERGAPVDQAHRHLEQERDRLLDPRIPEYETLCARLDEMRVAWRGWADAWARDFSALCRAEGFLPAPSHQQRYVFDDVVRKMTAEGETTAYFVIDALRFEMGMELYRMLAGTPATQVRIGPRLAELPTVTQVGMNVLAPVTKSGRLEPSLSAKDRPKLDGFSTGEFRVYDPESRRRAMHERVGGGTCPMLTLKDVVSRDKTSLKRAAAQSRLLVVHSQEIDTAGESGLGPSTFDKMMQRLRVAWSLLRDAGVRRFVFTSDHGFLLLDGSGGSSQAHGRRGDPSRRYAITSVAVDKSNEVRVPFSELGYEGAEGHLVFPETTAVFEKGGPPVTFAHGGNSLQERVIPVLTVLHRSGAGGSSLDYAVSAKEGEGLMGMHCLEIQVDVAGQTGLSFGSASKMELSLRVPEAPEVEVELCHARGGARVDGVTIESTIGSSFELFFKLSGPTDERVRVEIYHPGAAKVAPLTTEARFGVAPTTGATRKTDETPFRSRDWLDEIAEEGPRAVFRHLADHGTVTENEAADMLGGPRAARRFANRLEELARKAPFVVRVENVSGMKLYVREGGG